MDLDRGLLAAVIREQDFSAFQKISQEMIQGDSIAAYRFIEAYYLQYQKIPSYDLILNQTNIDLIQGINLREPSDFFVDKIKERYFWFKARDGAQSLVAALERQDSIQNIKAILTRMLHQELYDASSSDSLPRSIFNNGDEILREYERAKLEGLTGVPTPWPTVNRMTMGWQPEDFTLFVSRPGSGKTFLLIAILLHAWECGYKVMLFSTEMKILALKRRVMALLTKLSYSLIKAGRLSPSEYEIFKDTLHNFSADDRFLVVGNDTTLKRSIIEQNIAMGKPDLVGIDGYYMVEDDMEKHQKDDRGAIWKVGKKIAKKYQVPLLVTHQLNRKPQHEKPGQKPTLDRLAHSDAAGMYADFVFSIWQTEEMFNDKRLGLNPMKTRDSELKDAIEIRWDLTNGNFTEIDRNAVTSETSQVVDYTQPQEISDIPF
jgi:KaiC/GvpD/RAD55 family RecA-like ATPase